MGDLFGIEYNGVPFKEFSFTHILTLIIIAFIIYFILRFFKNKKNEKAITIFRYSLAAILLLQEFLFILWYVNAGMYSIKYILPLNFCGISLFLSAYMLITRNKIVFELIFFWGLMGSIIALILPDTSYNFPHFRFLEFFIAHAGIVLAALYMVYIEKFRPYIFSLVRIIIITILYLIFVGIINYVLGVNYLYLCNNPNNHGVIKYLGPWPWYIISFIAIGFVLLCIEYFPFWIKDGYNFVLNEKQTLKKYKQNKKRKK